MTLYVKAKSKKEINTKLESGLIVRAESFEMFGGGGSYKLDSSLPDGTVIKVFDKYCGGSPYAKAYGTWNSKKNRVM